MSEDEYRQMAALLSMDLDLLLDLANEYEPCELADHIRDFHEMKERMIQEPEFRKTRLLERI